MTLDKTNNNFIFLLVGVCMSACSADPKLQAISSSSANGLSGLERVLTHEERTAPGVRVEFKESHFYSLGDPNQWGCAGDVKTYFKVGVQTPTGQPIAFSAAESDPSITLKPGFINNISVDLTDSTSATQDPAFPNLSLGCSFINTANAPPPSICATFDWSSPVTLFTASYDTKYYSVFDDQCIDAGPILSGNPEISKADAGGFYIDLDRTHLKPNENLLLSLTYFPLGPENTAPARMLAGFTELDAAHFQVHLIQTGQGQENLLTSFQPRQMAYSDPSLYPKIVNTLSVLGRSTGSVREDQVILPISIDFGIDRIRVVRHTGSAVLITASIYRMGVI